MRPICITCQLHLSVDDIKYPLPVTLHALESVKITCPGRCKYPIAYGDMKTHDCTMRNTSDPNIILADVCNTRIDKTPCEKEWRVLGHLVKRFIKSSSTLGDENSIIIPMHWRPGMQLIKKWKLNCSNLHTKLTS